MREGGGSSISFSELKGRNHVVVASGGVGSRYARLEGGGESGCHGGEKELREKGRIIEEGKGGNLDPVGLKKRDQQLL